jgi:hypothetical protein
MERQRKKEEKVEKRRLRKEGSATESGDTPESLDGVEEVEEGAPPAP